MNNLLISRMAAKFADLRDRWFPTVIVRVDGAGKALFRYQANKWHSVSDRQGALSYFERRILLVPDAISYFQLRTFPADSVARHELREAVELDFFRWVPLEQDFDYYFREKKSGSRWQVAIWVWPRDELAAMAESLATPPGYVVPEMAWQISVVARDHDEFVLISKQEDTPVYLGVTHNFGSLVRAEVATGSDATRFWTSLDRRPGDITLLTEGEIREPDLPWEDLSVAREVHPKLPLPAALSAGRQPGTVNWSDASVWYAPVAGVLGLYLFWLLGSMLVLVKHGSDIRGYLEQTRSVSMEVLDARTEVGEINASLESIHNLRVGQSAFRSVLASLSETLPENAWLEYAEYRQDGDAWLEISGKSHQGSTLAATLEQLPEVRQAMFLSDIRKERATGYETFKIRLTLGAPE